MANKKQVASIVAALALLPPALIANAQEVHVCEPNKPLNKCEKALYDSAITWEGRAEETRSALSGCLDKLSVRTSTVINKLTFPPAPALNGSAFSKDDLVIYAGAGLTGFVLGVLVAAAIVR